MGFTEKLDKLMQERHLNKSTLAKESGIPYTTIDGFYKKGTENVKLSTLKKLCEFFGCSLDFLADDDVTEDVSTFAAHKDGDNFTPEELEKIEDFKKLLIAARPKE